MMKRPRPVLLAILDGWGHSDNPDKSHNALLQAKTPNLDSLAKQYPISFLEASELNVGLPTGQMGNSEVGHMNIGSGRVVLQELPKIDKAILEKTIPQKKEFHDFVSGLKACHLMGLLSDGGVHSHQNHFAEVAKYLAAAGVKVKLHIFLDGRDTPPSSALGFLKDFKNQLGENPLISFATVSGRYYSMDRDKRWDRTELAYNTIVSADAPVSKTPEAAIEASYKNNTTDEFVKPVIIEGYKGMEEGDGIMCINFRADRVRQILAAILDPEFSGFARKKIVKTKAALGMVQYSKDLAKFMTSLFPPETIGNTLGEIISKNGLKQLRIAETEKYAHVTYFFNGGVEKEYEGEKRILIPSPKVATYDLKPEMSAFEVTDEIVKAVESGEFDLIVVNYANGDMVGHTGNIQAAIKAAEAVDTCIGRVWAALDKAGGAMLISADHGNLEMMHDHETGQAHTAHTLNPVPFTVIGKGFESTKITLQNGILADIAPSILQIMGIEKPMQMTGKSLINEK